jgi:hypothetical protein
VADTLVVKRSTDLSKYMAGVQNPLEDITWPATLPIEVALKTASINDICAGYGIDRAGWEKLRTNPVFIKELQEIVDSIRKEGVSIRLKAGLQCDQYLVTAYKMIHSPTDEVPASVKADLLKFMFRVAGLDKSSEGVSNASTTLNIQMNLG